MDVEGSKDAAPDLGKKKNGAGSVAVAEEGVIQNSVGCSGTSSCNSAESLPGRFSFFRHPVQPEPAVAGGVQQVQQFVCRQG
jgi:hypothetical protein